jgi:hypothetical protein
MAGYQPVDFDNYYQKQISKQSQKFAGKIPGESP